MKTVTGSHRAGSALIIVLSLLVLLTAIVLTLLFRVKNDLTISQNYSDQANVKTLADTAVNLVIGQIRAGSSGVGQAWISQPGLIRTFNNSGNPVAAYKLYSANVMTDVSGTFNPTADAAALAADPVTAGNPTASGMTTDWSQNSNIYVDLNSPVMVSSNPVFPILEGNNMTKLPVGNKYLQTYSTNKSGVPDIEGFGVDLGYNASQPDYKESYSSGSAVSPANNPVQMPVKWLYVLKDGTLLTAKTIAGTANVTVGTGTVAPTGGNPIVGRIAFWTDDESSKIDVNTAGEGTYWDTPVANSQPAGGPGSPTASPFPSNNFDPDNTYETDLATRPPVANEFQHVPGHPATTCLSPVLEASLRDALGLPTENNLPTATPALTGSNRAKLVQAIDNLSPYLSDANGSIGGTTATDAVNTILGPVTVNTYPLYANSDEIFFNPANRTVRALATGTSTASVLSESRFFLTAHSSAPEVNLFNKPRVAIWPVPLTTSTQTTFDKHVALCATVGANNLSATPEAFYFTRSDPTSQTTDWSNRNAAIYTYLTGLAGSAWPGYGGGTGFVGKYGNDCNQIFTEIFDYIRCTNILDPTASTPYTSKASTTSPYTSASPAQGQVVPILPGNGTRGFGRIATISSLSLVLIKADMRLDSTKAETALITTDPSTGMPISPARLNYLGAVSNGNTYANSTRVEVSLVPQFFCPMAGWPALANDISFRFSNFQITVDGSNPFTGYTEPDLYDKGRIPTPAFPAVPFGSYMGPLVFTQPLAPSSSTFPNTVTSNFPNAPVVVAGLSPNLTTPAGTGTMIINGTVHVDVYAPHVTPGSTTGGPVIQSFDFTISNLTTPIPNLVLETVNSSGTTINPTAVGNVGHYTTAKVWEPTVQGGRVPSTADQTFIYPSAAAPAQTPSLQSGKWDVVRTIAPTGGGINGDMRLVAAMGTGAGAGTPQNPGTCFVAQNTSTGASAATTYLAYDFFEFMSRGQSTYTGGQTGYLFNAVPSGISFQYPPLPENIAGALNYLGKTGDWDNGEGLICDGPYLNKSDEGAQPHLTAYPSSPYLGDNYCLDYVVPPPSSLFIPVIFGSLPTGVLAQHPWQTLLFRPAKSFFPGGNAHPGAAVPNTADGSSTPSYPPYTSLPDHCLLDLFWMPSVQPYPISQPFATAGKINLNYQIAPFTYIERSTGLRAVLKSVKITALNPTQACPGSSEGASSTANSTLFKTYKTGGTWGNSSGSTNESFGGGAGISLRRSIDLDKTVQQFEDLYFSNNKPFISESQICDLPLIPLNNSGAGYVNTGIPSFPSTPGAASFDGYLKTFWAANCLTGDNSLERPYAAIYPRITTKSNVYTVHVWVQTIKQVTGAGASSNPAIFSSATDPITGEYRGSYVVERYLDPNTCGFYKNGVLDTSSNPEQGASDVLGPYKFRILSTKQFTE
jgi:hypothetical protein